MTERTRNLPPMIAARRALFCALLGAAILIAMAGCAQIVLGEESSGDGIPVNKARAQSLAEQGRTAAMENRFSDAHDLYEYALALDPDNDSAVRALAAVDA